MSRARSPLWVVLPVSSQRLDVPPLSLPATRIRVAQPRCPARHGEVAIVDRCREVEVELGPASDEDLLTRITRIVREAHVRPGVLQRKLDRLYMGNGFKQPGLESLGVVAAYLQDRCRAILLGDIAPGSGLNLRSRLRK